MKTFLFVLMAFLFWPGIALYVCFHDFDEVRDMGTLPVPQAPGVSVVLVQDQPFNHINGVYYRVLGSHDRLLGGPSGLFVSEGGIDASEFRVAAHDSVLVLTRDSPRDVVALYDLCTQTGCPGASPGETREDVSRRGDELLCRVQAQNPQLSWADYMARKYRSFP